MTKETPLIDKIREEAKFVRKERDKEWWKAVERLKKESNRKIFGEVMIKLIDKIFGEELTQ